VQLPISSLTHTRGTIPVSLLLPLVALDLILIVAALVDLIRRDPRAVRGNKIIWALIILFISTLGPVCYFVLGRKEI
jgi:glucose uptake protein GlcU